MTMAEDQEKTLQDNRIEKCKENVMRSSNERKDAFCEKIMNEFAQIA